MKAVIFDLDGTLVDSAPAVCAIANTFLAEIGLKPITLSETRNYIGLGAANFLQQALGARHSYDPRSFADRFSRFQALYNEAPGDANVAFPGADRALNDLKEKGFKLGLCTNKPGAPTMAVLDAMGWTGLFTAVVTGDTLPQRKPDPAPLREAMRGLSSTSAIYVGDSEIDAATATAAGVPFFLFTEGYRKSEVEEIVSTATFSDFGHLPDLVAANDLPLMNTARS